MSFVAVLKIDEQLVAPAAGTFEDSPLGALAGSNDRDYMAVELVGNINACLVEHDDVKTRVTQPELAPSIGDTPSPGWLHNQSCSRNGTVSPRPHFFLSPQ
jgi:hypothetical protein